MFCRRQELDRDENATGRGLCGQARKRAAPLRFAPMVTGPLSVADCMRRDEGRPDRSRRPAARRTKGWNEIR